MSHTIEEVMVPLHAVCVSCYEQQLVLLETAQLVSAPTTAGNLQLLLQYNTVKAISPFPEVSVEQMTELASLQAVMASVSEQDELKGLRTNLVDWMAALHEEDLSAATIAARPRTTNGLNKRMRDSLFQMKAKIRKTRKRLFDADEDYDKEAFVSTRNQLFLSWSVYMEELRLDLITATNAECAEVETILLPAIENASGNDFVGSLSNLRDFIQARILPGDKA